MLEAPLGALKRLVRGSRLEPVARELVRATWPRARAVDHRDQASLHRLLGYVLREDSNCVDVGCHQGAVLWQMVARAPRGRHHAFEPLPHLAAALRARFPAVAVHELALSEEAGDAAFHHVVTNAGYSGLRRRTYERPDERVERVVVRTARLDDLIPAELPIAFVKIDVEGAELQVLRGAERTLRAWRPYVVFEHGRGAADHYGTTPEMVHRLLDGCGLAVFGLDGEGPLDEAALRGIYDAGSAWNFLARPYRA